ncbi:unnamed protein product [Amoebophrya sp. A120]|nr:unnamed protein product [Amoebophrya sp. A120]|eukprot:GSA120T00007957001.1
MHLLPTSVKNKNKGCVVAHAFLCITTPPPVLSRSSRPALVAPTSFTTLATSLFRIRLTCVRVVFLALAASMLVSGIPLLLSSFLLFDHPYILLIYTFLGRKITAKKMKMSVLAWPQTEAIPVRPRWRGRVAGLFLAILQWNYTIVSLFGKAVLGRTPATTPSTEQAKWEMQVERTLDLLIDPHVDHMQMSLAARGLQSGRNFGWSDETVLGSLSLEDHRGAQSLFLEILEELRKANLSGHSAFTTRYPPAQGALFKSMGYILEKAWKVLAGAGQDDTNPVLPPMHVRVCGQEDELHSTTQKIVRKSSAATAAADDKRATPVDVDRAPQVEHDAARSASKVDGMTERLGQFSLDAEEQSRATKGRRGPSSRITTSPQAAGARCALVNVLGDTHGHFLDTLRIIRDMDLLNQTSTHIVFLGDYVDRGPKSESLAMVLFVFYLKARLPDRVTLLRGNHELPGLNGADQVRNDNTSNLKEDVFAVLRPSSVASVLVGNNYNSSSSSRTAASAARRRSPYGPDSWFYQAVGSHQHLRTSTTRGGLFHESGDNYVPFSALGAMTTTPFGGHDHDGGPLSGDLQRVELATVFVEEFVYREQINGLFGYLPYVATVFDEVLLVHAGISDFMPEVKNLAGGTQERGRDRIIISEDDEDRGRVVVDGENKTSSEVLVDKDDAAVDDVMLTYSTASSDDVPSEPSESCPADEKDECGRSSAEQGKVSAGGPTLSSSKADTCAVTSMEMDVEHGRDAEMTAKEDVQKEEICLSSQGRQLTPLTPSMFSSAASAADVSSAASAVFSSAAASPRRVDVSEDEISTTSSVEILANKTQPPTVSAMIPCGGPCAGASSRLDTTVTPPQGLQASFLSTQVKKPGAPAGDEGESPASGGLFLRRLELHHDATSKPTPHNPSAKTTDHNPAARALEVISRPWFKQFIDRTLFTVLGQQDEAYCSTYNAQMWDHCVKSRWDTMFTRFVEHFAKGYVQAEEEQDVEKRADRLASSSFPRQDERPDDGETYDRLLIRVFHRLLESSLGTEFARTRKFLTCCVRETFLFADPWENSLHRGKLLPSKPNHVKYEKQGNKAMEQKSLLSKSGSSVSGSSPSVTLSTSPEHQPPSQGPTPSPSRTPRASPAGPPQPARPKREFIDKSVYMSEILGRAESSRLRMINGGWTREVTEKFLEKNQLKLIIRGHQPSGEDSIHFRVGHDGKLIHLLSAPDYYKTWARHLEPSLATYITLRRKKFSNERNYSGCNLDSGVIKPPKPQKIDSAHQPPDSSAPGAAGREAAEVGYIIMSMEKDANEGLHLVDVDEKSRFSINGEKKQQRDVGKVQHDAGARTTAVHGLHGAADSMEVGHSALYSNFTTPGQVPEGSAEEAGREAARDLIAGTKKRSSVVSLDDEGDVVMGLEAERGGSDREKGKEPSRQELVDARVYSEEDCPSVESCVEEFPKLSKHDPEYLTAVANRAAQASCRKKRAAAPAKRADGSCDDIENDRHRVYFESESLMADVFPNVSKRRRILEKLEAYMHQLRKMNGRLNGESDEDDVVNAIGGDHVDRRPKPTAGSGCPQSLELNPEPVNKIAGRSSKSQLSVDLYVYQSVRGGSSSKPAEARPTWSRQHFEKEIGFDYEFCEESPWAPPCLQDF